MSYNNANANPFSSQTKGKANKETINLLVALMSQQIKQDLKVKKEKK